MLNYKFLVVDDEADLVEDLVSLIKEDLPESTIHSTTSSLEAIDFCKANVYDIILSDFKMPELNGDQMVLKIRELENDNAIILSAHGEIPDVSLKEIKHVMIMNKPLQRDEYRKNIKILLSFKS